MTTTLASSRIAVGMESVVDACTRLMQFARQMSLATQLSIVVTSGLVLSSLVRILREPLQRGARPRLTPPDLITRDTDRRMGESAGLSSIWPSISSRPFLARHSDRRSAFERSDRLGESIPLSACRAGWTVGPHSARHAPTRTAQTVSAGPSTPPTSTSRLSCPLTTRQRAYRPC